MRLKSLYQTSGFKYGLYNSNAWVEVDTVDIFEDLIFFFFKFPEFSKLLNLSKFLKLLKFEASDWLAR